MKKLLLLAALLGASLLVVACGDNNGNKTEVKQPTPAPTSTPTDGNETKIIVSYFKLACESTGIPAEGGAFNATATVVTDTVESMSGLKFDSAYGDSEFPTTESSANGIETDVVSDMVYVANDTGISRRVSTALKYVDKTGTKKLAARVCVQLPLEKDVTDKTSDDNASTDRNQTK